MHPHVAAQLEVVPNQAQYRPGQPVRITIRHKEGESLAGCSYACTVMELDIEIQHTQGFWSSMEMEDGSAALQLASIGQGSGAYGVFVTVTGPRGERWTGETAFDVAKHWSEAPRYGFLSDFAPEEAGRLDDVEFLNRHHINLVQFYDWMYRHDRYVSDRDTFVDPLGRPLSHAVAREKIAALRERGIASMAYVAVYASLPDYVERHPEQGLYRNDGKTHSLGSFFHIMDISADSAWTRHMLEEYRDIIGKMDFDGIHLDQYGFPKKAIRRREGRRDVVELKKLYPSFINQVREELDAIDERLGVIFNNVSNYPTHTTAEAAQDIMYIEVWDPASHLRDLKQIITNARIWSGKQVVLAAYLPAFHPEQPAEPGAAEAGARLAMATIFASGGYHLLLGEHGNVLTDPYFPKYGRIEAGFQATLQRHYDFIVMYRDLLFDLALDDVSMAYTGGINTEVAFSCGIVRFTPNQQPDTVWTWVKEKPGVMVLHLINLLGADNDIWHEPKHSAPVPLRHIEVSVELWEEVEGVYWATPDGESIRPEPLAYTWEEKGEDAGLVIRFVLPDLAYWSFVYIKLREGVPPRSFA